MKNVNKAWTTTGIYYLQKIRENCKGALLLQSVAENAKKGIKISFFIPQRYEVPTSVTIFANGSGRNDAELIFCTYFATFVNPPGPILVD